MAKYGVSDPAVYQLRDIKRRLTKAEKKATRHEITIETLRKDLRKVYQFMEAQVVFED